MPTVARSVLLRELAQDLSPEDYLEFTALDNIDTTTTTVAASELRSDDASTNKYDGAWFYVYSGTGVGDERRIAAYDPRKGTNYGQLTYDRPGTDLDATSKCLVYNSALSPSALVRQINASLRRLRRQRLLPFTLIEDGLMEDSGVSKWTATTATLSKITTAANIYEGAQALRVLNSAVDGRARSALIPVEPGSTYVVEAVCQIANSTGTHTATLRVQDETGAASTATATSTSRERTRLRITFSPLSGSYRISVRLEGSAADSDIYWDDVLLWRPTVKQLALPTDLERWDQVYNAFERLPHSDSGPAHAVDYRRLANWHLLADPTAATLFLLDLSDTGWSGHYPVLVDCLLPWAELTSDAATTAASQDDVVLRARALCYAVLARAGPREDRSFYEKMADKLAQTWATHAAYQPRRAYPIGRRRG